MASPLLATKLYLPPLRPDRVSRPHLVEQLGRGLLPGMRLVLVSAPAGFGKTTLASEWARSSGLPVAWLALDESDNDPVRFWHYVIAALQTVNPTLGREMDAALDAPSPPAIEALLALLLNDLIRCQKPLLWVLDDYHLVETPGIHTALSFLLDHLPAEIHLALLTRADPPLQLARRRGRGELVEVRAGDLRFSEEEAGQFFSRAMRLALTGPDVQALEQRTEGWVAGLQMAALALQSQPGNPEDFIASFTGDDRYIADYLVEEVLERQPQTVQQFLLRTAVLNRFSAGLCDALTGELSPGSGSQQVLDYLDRANLFLVPLDNRREWFRYHHLFAQLLRQRGNQVLGSVTMAEQYRRAAAWHFKNGDPSEGVEYALTGGDFELAAGMIVQIIQMMMLRSELTTIRRWGERLPMEVLARHPALCVGLAWAANATGHQALCETWINLAERTTQVSVANFLAMDEATRRRLPPDQLGAVVELSVLRARQTLDQGHLTEILEKYRPVLSFLTAERSQEPYIFNQPLVLRSPMVFMISLVQELLGQLEAALLGYAEAADLSERMFNIHIVALALGHQGQIQMTLGRLRAAEITFRRAVAIAASQQGGHLSAFFGLAHAGLGNLAYERGDLETARRELEYGLHQGRLWNNWEVQLPAYVGLLRLTLAENNLAAAREALNGLEALGKIVPAIIGPLVAAWRAQLWVRQGQPGRAASWAEQTAARLPGPAVIASITETIALARVWLAQVQPQRAADLLAPQAAVADAAGQCSSWLQLQVLRAAALELAGQRSIALAVLAEVLPVAENEGYLRTFVDEGQSIAALLRALQTQGTQLPAVTRLLAGFDSEPVPATPLPGELPEALSPRELEILRLLATEATNAAIAERCYISVNTLKKHISNIYGKLGAATRLQAVQRAQQLKIL